MSIPEIEALASPPVSTPWVPLWPLGGVSMGELAYAEIIVGVSAAAGTEAGATTVVTAPAITVDGATPILVEFHAPYAYKGTSWIRLVLFDGSTPLGCMAHSDVSNNLPIRFTRRLTPSAGTHTYSIRAYVDAGAGGVGAGVGGAGAYAPASIRISLAAPISNAPAGALLPVQYGTSLPASPVDGQEAILVDSLTNPTYQWRFRYNAGSASAYRWEFVGGSPAMHNIDAAEAIGTGGTWVNLATDGPKITVPRAGDYKAEWGGMAYNANGSAISMYAGISVGDTNPLVYYGGLIYLINALAGVSPVAGVYKFLAVPASTAIKLRYFASTVAGGQQSFQMRAIAVTPVRVA